MIHGDEIAGRVASIVNDAVGRPLDAKEPLLDAGLDSLGAVELRSRLNDEFAVQLPSTVVFDHPSVYALAEAVAGELSHGKSKYGTAHVLRNSTIDVTYSAQVCISSVSSPWAVSTRTG